MLILSKAIYSLNVILTKISTAFFTELGKKKFYNPYEDREDPKSPKQSWERTKLEMPHFLISNYVRYSYSNQNTGMGTDTDQCNRIEKPEISLY